MKLSRQTSTFGLSMPITGRTTDPLLPHETDQLPQSQEEEEPRYVGKQAYDDMQCGRVDTDRWGGEDYQRRTQNDAIVNIRSAKRGVKRRNEVT